MRFLLHIAVCVAVSVLNACAAMAGVVEQVDRFAAGSENRLEQRFFADASDGRLDSFSPLGAALTAGGAIDADEVQRYEQKAAALAGELKDTADWESLSSRDRAQRVFEFLHRRVLTGGYDLSATDLRKTFDTGRFNCVSATVLFNYFAESVGLECVGLEMPGHAMSRVRLAGGPLDIETTCPQWLGDSQDRRVPMPASVAMRTIGASASADRSKVREVSIVQLSAMIYYNRGVDDLAEKRFALAAADNAKSLRLDPTNATARGNFLATLNNWSIELGSQRHFIEALDLLRCGLAIDSSFEAFQKNYAHVHRQWTEYLCDQGRFDEAVAVLAQADGSAIRFDVRRDLENAVRRRWEQAASDQPVVGQRLEWPCVKDAPTVD